MHTRSSIHRQGITLRAVLAASLFAVMPPAFSEMAMWLIGPVTPTGISGVDGTSFTLGLPEGTHGVYGLRSAERNDKPCYIAAMTENVNDFKEDSEATENLCGANPTGSEMKVEFGDIEFAPRTFVRGLRVCMNSENTRVKGIQIRGSVIDADGKLSDLPPRYPDSSASSGVSSMADLSAPIDLRRTCDSWQKWVECTERQIATAVTALFEPGSNPRSLTGIVLQCRTVATRREWDGPPRP